MNTEGLIVETGRQLTKDEIEKRSNWQVETLLKIETERGINLSGPPYFMGHRVTGTIWDFFILPLLDRIRELECNQRLAQTPAIEPNIHQDVTELRIGDRVKVTAKPSGQALVSDFHFLNNFDVSRGIIAGMIGTVEDVSSDIVGTVNILVKLDSWHQGHSGEGRGKDEYWFFFPEQLGKI